MVPAASPETCVFSLGAENHIPAFGVPLVQSLLCLLGGHHSPEHWLVWELTALGPKCWHSCLWLEVVYYVLYHMLED